MNSLWPKHHIHYRRSTHNGIAFLAGDTATYTDDQIRLVAFSFASALIDETPFLGLFRDRAGI